MLGFLNGVFSSPSGLGYIPQMEQIISQLERGTLVTKFSWRKKCERKTLAIRRETRQLIWMKPELPTSKPSYDGAVDLGEIKEVRLGKNSKDFDKWPEDAAKIDYCKCFVVFYGSQFNLRVLSIAALSEAECGLWTKGLRYLVKDTIFAPYPLQVQGWLRREFYDMEGPGEMINLKNVKSLLPRVNCKIPTSKLREIFNEVDSRKKTEIGFDDFALLYQKLILDENNITEIFDKIHQYSSDTKTITLKEFESFLRNEQDSSEFSDSKTVTQFIYDFLRDPQREIQQPYLNIPEFLDYLFSKQNDLWDPKKDTVYQDMTKPLSHYWIASSHNTYLTGDQLSSESSVEAYVRCLRMGCRCIELDCWDGPDGIPFIYHGHTLTTKIKFMDVIRTIKEHAFATSEYPVILSIEDNCSVPQQRKMASALQEVFGDMLVTSPVEHGESVLPSPYTLRRRIILKHKKLPEGQEDTALLLRNDQNEMDLRNSVKNGIMYLEDPVEKIWNPHFFVLTNHKLFYTDSYRPDGTESERSEDEDEGHCFGRPKANVPNEELHFSEKWFHGRLPNVREDAEQLLRRYSHLGDGTFLVRASGTFVGEYCLSFWRNGHVNHCRIRSRQDKQQTKYFLIEGKYFDSLYSLISHYRATPLVTAEFSITLRDPVPQPNLHENKEWYHKNMGRTQSEEVLKRVKTEGAFLVRPSENDVNCFTISFRADRKIKHCRVKLEGRLYTIGNVEFESLVELINYYENHPLYRRVKLSLPISEETVRRLTSEQEDPAAYHATPSYMDPAALQPKITMKALYDYRAQRPDELSFCKHSIVTNVRRPENTPGWLLGDYGGKMQHYFPENYAKEVERVEPQDVNDEPTGESMVQGSLDMNGAVVDVKHNPECPGVECALKISTSAACTPFECGVQSHETALEWRNAIREVTQRACQLENQHKEREREYRIAKELSHIIIYCRSITFNLERSRAQGFIFYEMSSFPENKAEKLICQKERKFFLKYHQVQFTRVYPKKQRLDSSNYNPTNLWNCGSQMVALNYQTGDKPMQLNQAKFRDNGNAGYLLKPEFTLRDDFDPYDRNTLVGVAPLKISIRVIAGRHLCRSKKKGVVSPFVEVRTFELLGRSHVPKTVEVIGAPFDSGVKLTTKRILDNGFNPKWQEEICEFVVANPHFALLRFLVQDEDVFGEPNFIGQATYPAMCLRTGYRSVWLKNGYSEDVELGSLLIHMSISNNAAG